MGNKDSSLPRKSKREGAEGGVMLIRDFIELLLLSPRSAIESFRSDQVLLRIKMTRVFELIAIDHHNGLYARVCVLHTTPYCIL